ncbi:hypothetical protein QW131_26380 [Roseibium salinum]|nr:hypothetical protein [Roseibium salinum]
MSVAETIVVPDVDTDVSTATNDLTDDVVKGTIILPAPGEKNLPNSPVSLMHFS